MTATNHYLSGVLIATVYPKPLVAIPLALISHFALDALPHFGDENYRQKLPKFYKIWRTDFVILIAMVAWTLFNAPVWFVLAGFIATSPDLAWVYRFQFIEKGGKYHKPKMHWLNRFHSSIQKLERPWGIYIEIIFAVLLASSIYIIGN